MTEEIIREIWANKNEPEWMLEFRLKAYDHFIKTELPTWGADLSNIDFEDYTYYIKPSDKQSDDWENVNETIKDTFDNLGIL